MLKKFLKEIVIIVVGKQAEDIVDLLDSKKHVNEFIVAKKLDITINQTRNILYKIADHGLVSSIRKKDKKKGWYTYFWKFEILKSLEFLKSILMKKINQLNAQIESRETKEFYICERCNIEFNEEHALVYDFTCNECGNIFVRKDNTKVLKEFNKSLNRLKKEIEFVDVEIEKEREKVEKIKAKEIKREEKEKAEKRAEKRAIAKKKREAEKRKLEKENPIKKKSKKESKKPIKKKKSKKKSVKKTGKKKIIKGKNAIKKKIAKKKLKKGKK